MDKLLYKPNTENRDYKFVMAYPEKEEFALSSLGYMWLFKISDTHNGIDSARISTDSPVLPFKHTDAVAFSLSFDFDFNGVFEILERNKIPFLSSERDSDYPLIFAGGPVITTNPKPYDDIFDFMIIGDGEEVFEEVLNILKQRDDKRTTLEKLSNLDGIYIPKISKKVKKRIAELNNVIYTPILCTISFYRKNFI